MAGGRFRLTVPEALLLSAPSSSSSSSRVMGWNFLGGLGVSEDLSDEASADVSGEVVSGASASDAMLLDAGVDEKLRKSDRLNG